MMTALLIIHLLITIALVGLVLLQRSEGGGLGIGGGGGGGFMTTRGTANVLTRLTVGFAAAFFATSIGLSLLAGVQRSTGGIGSVTDTIPTEQSAPRAPATDQPPAGTGTESDTGPAEGPSEDDGLPEVPVGD